MKKRSDKYRKNKIIVFFKILLYIIIFCLLVLLWARFISTSGLKVNEIKIVDQKLSESFHGFKIVHFSDVHYGKTIDKNSLEKIVDKINLIKPNLVLFTGDLLDKDIKITDSVINELSNILNKIESSHGKYAVKGNHDYTSDSFIEIMQRSEFNVLENSYDLVYNDVNEYIYLGGLSSSIKTEIDYEKTTEYFKDENVNKNIFSIMLLHEPDNIDKLLEYQSVNLALSGHSHGGQIRLPIIGPVFKIQGAIKYPNNYYKVNDTNLYVSYGLGTSNYPFRFMNKPSINFYRLYTK
ncbi:MAG: metallophosphoesterase [Firmicutes bacterium]|nr:metallophosphoesterase [Bacillota bacterium]